MDGNLAMHQEDFECYEQYEKQNNMLKTNELRLDNLLVYPSWNKDGKDKIWKVRDVFREDDRVGLTDEILQTSTQLKYLNPIPLSEEILLKCGFEYCDGKSEWLMKLNISASTLYCRSNKDKFYWQFNETYLSNMIDSLHKLQNFVYTFGQELNTSGLI